jgi:hypothetical protein
MLRHPAWRSPWLICLAAIILTGILSRIVHTGSVLVDKYLGDALYAAMIYALLRLRWPTHRAALAASAVMLAIESFQLTLIPAHLARSEPLLVRIVARLLGTQFSWWDLFAYAVGIGVIARTDAVLPRRSHAS